MDKEHELLVLTFISGFIAGKDYCESEAVMLEAQVAAKKYFVKTTHPYIEKIIKEFLDEKIR